MILCGHQPGYLPGLQFFSKIMQADAFMYCPDMQFQKKSWHAHNYIKTGLLSVPTHASLGDSIRQTKIDYTKNWQRKHLRAIEMAYHKAPFFRDFYDDLQFIITYRWPNLARLNMEIIDWLTRELNCGKFDKCFYQQAGHPNADPVASIIEMCKQVNCDTYLSNEGAHAYIDDVAEKRMADAGITHRWLAFADPDYGQDKKFNEGRLCVLDALFMHGPETTAKIIEAHGQV